METSGSILRQFHDLMRLPDMWRALSILNSRSPYRFTAVFAFDKGNLHNVCLVDKDNPDTKTCPDQPIEQSYCVYVKNTERAFGVAHSRMDDRTIGHPKRELFQAYYGVPLLSTSGKLLGTVCHFDPLNRKLPEETMGLLADAASSIVESIEAGWERA